MAPERRACSWPLTGKSLGMAYCLSRRWVPPLLNLLFFLSRIYCDQLTGDSETIYLVMERLTPGSGPAAQGESSGIQLREEISGGA
jgi:hypothetical protein